MIILGIETSCDETALALIEKQERSFKVLAEALISQTKIHEQYGGVFPMMAKREHSNNLIPLLQSLLGQAGMLRPLPPKTNRPLPATVEAFLVREPELLAALRVFVSTYELDGTIDAIAVTEGPGLEPALWVGINAAQAIGALWNIPVIPTNHMEGHIVGSLIDSEKASDKERDEYIPLATLEFPSLALLISGGHTELVLIKGWRQYALIGRTRDDAAGEAFDKIARIIGLPYPGGPELSRLAHESRMRSGTAEDAVTLPSKLPRPMIGSDDFDFSFAGLKTAVLYMVRDLGGNDALDARVRGKIAEEAENALCEVIVAKTKKAIEEYGVHALIVGGGVSANTYIRRALADMATRYHVKLYLPHDRHCWRPRLR
jgi:N6-L-threonylcarbamoyladenine synthase